jgi:hypothetical protein
VEADRVSASLDWVLACLWDGNAPVRVSTGPTVPVGYRAAQSFAVLPSAARPRLLVPLASGRAASTTLSHYRSGKRLVRLATPALALALRAGGARLLLRDRVEVSIEDGDSPVALCDVLLTEHLREVFGGRDLHVAVLFDSPRPHRKPTLHIMGADGTPLGFAKIGWNGLTRSLVRAEARVLEDLGRGRVPQAFTVPRLIHAGSFGQLEILVVEPVSLDAPRRGRRLLREPPAAASAEVARLEGTTRGPLAESAYWSGVRERLTAVEIALGPDARPELSAAANELERRDGQTELEFGFWHGDWVPWNMGFQRGRLFVWDWERGGRPAPVGLDAVHFEYQAVLGLRRIAPWPAAQRTLERSGRVLSSLAVSDTLGRQLLSLHLLEMSLRFDEARAAGVDTADPKYLPVLTRLLAAT